MVSSPFVVKGLETFQVGKGGEGEREMKGEAKKDMGAEDKKGGRRKPLINSHVLHCHYSQQRCFFKCNGFWVSHSLTMGMKPKPGHFPFSGVPSVKTMRLVTPEQPIEPDKVLWLGPASSSYSDSSFLSPDPVTCQVPHGQKVTSNTCRQRETLWLLAIKAEHQ